MPTLQFTDLTVGKLKTDKQTRFWDIALPSFGILCGKRTKTWICMRGSDRKLVTLGRYPAVSLKNARQAALRVIDGTESVTETLTATTALRQFIDGHRGSKRWKYDLNYLLTRHLLKDYDLPLNQITPRHVLTITDSLVDTPAQRLHTHRALSAFFKWATLRQFLDRSPMQGLPPPCKAGKRDRVLSYEELAKIWRAAHHLRFFGDIIKLCILLGQRRTEISLISPSNFTSSILTLPAPTTKARREHSLPLTATSYELLASLQRCSINWAIQKEKLDELSGVQNYVIHDIRRSFTTHLAELGVLPHILERILNHTTGQISGVAAIYNRAKYFPEVKAALELWEAELVKRAVIS